MKHKVFSLVFTLMALTAMAQRGVRMAYVDMEYILQNVDEYKEANAQLNSRIQKWKLEVEEQKNTIEQMRKDLNAEKVLLTKELIEEREEEIKALEDEMLQYQQDRFGPQGDMVIQRRLLVQPIQDQVFNAVQEIGANKKYDFIFDKSADVVMLFSDKRHDLSDQVLRSINRTRKQQERKTDPNANSITKFEDEEPEVNPAVEAKKKEAESKLAERQRLAQEKREQRLKDIEERKKAQEAKKQEAIDARKASVTPPASEESEEVTDEESLSKEEQKAQELEERKKALEEKRAEKQQQIEAQREARLKQIEERKKAYEERRKKILEERAKKAAGETQKVADTIQDNN